MSPENEGEKTSFRSFTLPLCCCLGQNEALHGSGLSHECQMPGIPSTDADPHVNCLCFLSPVSAFCLGGSYGSVCWKMLPRMCPKALLGVGKNLPGDLRQTTPKPRDIFWHICLSLLLSLWLSASTYSLVQTLLFSLLERQESWKKSGLDKNLLANKKEVCRAKQMRHFLFTLVLKEESRKHQWSKYL